MLLYLKKCWRPMPRNTGFTLIEMVISVAIIALLAALVLPVEELVVKRSKEQELRVALREIRTAIDSYKAAVDDKRIDSNLTESGYPPSLGILVEGMQDKASTDKRSKMRFLRRMPRDPFSDPNISAEMSWGLRSYASHPDSPRAGDDVFDVYSRSPAVGINGVPYGKW